MSCPRCRSESTLKKGYRTSLGCRIYYCRNCKRRFNERVLTDPAGTVTSSCTDSNVPGRQ